MATEVVVNGCAYNSKGGPESLECHPSSPELFPTETDCEGPRVDPGEGPSPNPVLGVPCHEGDGKGCPNLRDLRRGRDPLGPLSPCRASTSKSRHQFTTQTEPTTQLGTSV